MDKRITYKTHLVLLMLWLCAETQGQVNFLGSIEELDGILLFQAADNENGYYYLPAIPRIKQTEGSYEAHLAKYLNHDGSYSGGIFTATIEFSLSPQEREKVQHYIKRKNPKAHLIGQLPLYRFAEDGQHGKIGFQLVSSTFNPGNNAIVKKALVSRSAPLQHSAKAYLSIELTKEGASILEQSLKMGTSDLSVVITAYYPALAPSFYAKAALTTSSISERVYKKNANGLLSKDELKNLVVELDQEHSIAIEIFDDSEGQKDSEEKQDAILTLLV